MKCLKHFLEFYVGGCPECKREYDEGEREEHEFQVALDADEAAHLRNLPAPDA